MLSFPDHPLNIYTDGSFDPGTRSGGWAFVVLDGDAERHAASGTGTCASNNGFELLSAVQAMHWIAAHAAQHTVILWSDSAHVVEGCLRWRPIWRGNGWKRIVANPHARRRPIPDAALWREFDGLLQRNPGVTIRWCKGHAETDGNLRADRLARQALGSAGRHTTDRG